MYTILNNIHKLYLQITMEFALFYILVVALVAIVSFLLSKVWSKIIFTRFNNPLVIS